MTGENLATLNTCDSRRISMERLDFDDFKYNATEGTIHLARYLNAKPYVYGKRVLDAACGEGYGTRLMYNWGASSVVGVDISEVAIDKATKIFGTENVSYMRHNVEELPFPDNSFDVVVSLETIEHLDEPAKFLTELHRVLKKGGTAIISCPNDNYYVQNIPDYTNIYHKKRYSWTEFKQLVETEFGKASHWFMGNSLSGYINLPLSKCNEPETAPKSPENMQCIMQAQSLSEIELIPQDEYVNHWVSVYYVGVWTREDTKRDDESAAVYPVPTFSLHHDKVVPDVNPYSMIKELTEKEQIVRDELCLVQKQMNDLSTHNISLTEEHSQLKEAHRVMTNERDRLKGMNDMLAEENLMLSNRVEQLTAEKNDLINSSVSNENRIHEIEASQEYRFGLRCRPFLKIFSKPLLFVLHILRKMRNIIRKFVH